MKNKLKKLIQDANPSIMELKFGCEFEWVDENFEEENYKIVNVTGFEDMLTNTNSFELQAFKVKDIHKELFSFDGYDEEYEQSFFDIAKVLGRPIQLADVLVAMEKKEDLDYISVNQCGEFCATYDGSLEKYWNLKKDLDGQSDEVIEFLFNLLNKPN